MSAHNQATRQLAQERFQWVIDNVLRQTRYLDNPLAQHWAYGLEQALLRPTEGTLKSYMQERHGERVETLQVSIHLNPDTARSEHYSNLWIPGYRTVNAERSKSVRLDGSVRDYAGVITLAQGGGYYLGITSAGRDAEGRLMLQLIAYAD